MASFEPATSHWTFRSGACYTFRPRRFTRHLSLHCPACCTTVIVQTAHSTPPCSCNSSCSPAQPEVCLRGRTKPFANELVGVHQCFTDSSPYVTRPTGQSLALPGLPFLGHTHVHLKLHVKTGSSRSNWVQLMRLLLHVADLGALTAPLMSMLN